MRKNLLAFLLFFIIVLVSQKAYNQDTITSSINKNTPQLNGILKTKLEFDLENRLYKFSVRNARFSIRDDINDFFGYKMEIDFSDEGKISMLDAYIKFNPTENFEISLGQRKIPFGTDYMRNPAENFFANRSFVSKYINSGLRDIGAIINYKRKIIIPTEIFLAALNGTGNNNPNWVKIPDFAGRLVLGNEKGLRITANGFMGEKELEKNLHIFGYEARYATDVFLIESEFIHRNWTDTSDVRLSEEGIYLHTYYKFNITGKNLKNITPTARWDLMSKNIFESESFAERLTLGLNFGFEKKLFYSEIRLNYEKYFITDLPEHTDKLVIEFLARF